MKMFLTLSLILFTDVFSLLILFTRFELFIFFFSTTKPLIEFMGKVICSDFGGLRSKCCLCDLYVNLIVYLSSQHVGWWSPTIIRGDEREAVYIPNHKFTVSVVRNLTQKTHWRIKTHIAISHLDVNKINVSVKIISFYCSIFLVRKYWSSFLHFN